MTVAQLIERLQDSRIPRDATFVVQVDDCCIVPLVDAIWYPDMSLQIFLTVKEEA